MAARVSDHIHVLVGIDLLTKYEVRRAGVT
jgi:hypothetical protein